MKFEIENPALWWPRGYGEANQYAITATLLKNGEIDGCDFLQAGTAHGGIEIRSDILDETARPSSASSSTARRVYVKGTNWVPADAFHSNDGGAHAADIWNW